MYKPRVLLQYQIDYRTVNVTFLLEHSLLHLVLCSNFGMQYILTPAYDRIVLRYL